MRLLVPCAVAAGLIGPSLTTSSMRAAVTTSYSYTAALSATEEVPTPGPAGASGTATVTIDTVTNQLCYAVTWSREVGTPSAGHIHLGAKGTAGPIQVVLDVPSRPKACLPVDRSVLQSIVSSPSNHYVNIHSQAYPGGAVRGQLH